MKKPNYIRIRSLYFNGLKRLGGVETMPRARSGSSSLNSISFGSGRTIERNNLPMRDPFERARARAPRWFFVLDVGVAGRGSNGLRIIDRIGRVTVFILLPVLCRGFSTAARWSRGEDSTVRGRIRPCISTEGGVLLWRARGRDCG